jgi:hypothetical protein
MMMMIQFSLTRHSGVVEPDIETARSRRGKEVQTTERVTM